MHSGRTSTSAQWMTRQTRVALFSIARFSFEGVTDGRSLLDAARLFSRLVRNIDFACRDQDGSILAAFTETDLRSAHVVARRIASVLCQTMVSPGRDRRSIRPSGSRSPRSSPRTT